MSSNFKLWLKGLVAAAVGGAAGAVGSVMYAGDVNWGAVGGAAIVAVGAYLKQSPLWEF